MKLRFRITKDAEIRYISHLEYVRTIERAVRRAKLPAAYSEGFNPHLKLSLASALSLGVASLGEYAELEIAEEAVLSAVAEQFSAALPRGIRLLELDLVPKKSPKLMATVGGADYLITVPCGPVDCAETEAEYQKAPEVNFTKVAPKAKTRTKIINVKDFVRTVKLHYGNGQLTTEFSCLITPTGSLKAGDFLAVLHDRYQLPFATDEADILRLDLYTRDEEGRRCSLLSPERLCCAEGGLTHV